MTDRVNPGLPWLICIGLLLCAMALQLVSFQAWKAPIFLVAPVARTVPVARWPVHARQYAGTVLARPLFSAHRRPPADAAGPAPAGMAAAPRLSGIVIAANTRRALFESQGRLLAGLVGEHVGPYAIVAITPRQVSVIGPFGLQTLTPGFSTSATASVPPSGPSILDRLRSQPFRQPALPSSAALNRLLLQQTHAATASPR